MPKIPALPYIRAGLTEGLSANETYRRYRAAAAQASAETGETWQSMRESVFRQTYGALRIARDNVQEAVNAPRNEPGGGLNIPDREASVPSGYLNWAVSFTRQVNSTDVERGLHPFRSAQPLTPAQVEDLVTQQIQESQTQQHGTFRGAVIVTISYVGAEKLTQAERF